MFRRRNQTHDATHISAEIDEDEELLHKRSMTFDYIGL